MPYMNEKGVVVINDGLPVLLRELRRALPHTMVTIIGSAGTGKTTIAESLMEVKELKIDKTVIFRIQGITSEDFRMPILKNVETIASDGTKTMEKEVSFEQIGVFKDIDKNKDKNYLLVLDEVNRCEREVRPLLFSLFERKLLDGIKRENLMIIAAVNDGDEYDVNLEFNDPALRRRTVFLEYKPTKEDFLTHIKRKRYHSMLVEVGETLTLGDIMNYDTTKEYEQTTNFGSFFQWNERLKTIEKEYGRATTYKEAGDDMLMFGSMFFSDATKKTICEKLIMLDSLNTIDIHKEIIEVGEITNNIKDKNGKHYNISGREKELLIKAMTFIKTQAVKTEQNIIDNGLDPNQNYFHIHRQNILKIFQNEKTLCVTMMRNIQDDFEAEFGTKEGKERYRLFSRALTSGLTADLNNKDKTIAAITKELFDEFVKVFQVYRNS